MKSSKVICAVLSTLIYVYAAAPTSAAESGLTIPRIEGEPTLADFSGMQPSTSLARSMSKVENFIQREPYPGQASAQRTEVYVGYDQNNLHVVFLAFDTNPELIRSNLSPRENIFQDDQIYNLIKLI